MTAHLDRAAAREPAFDGAQRGLDLAGRAIAVAAYLRRLYYDCVTDSEAGLRFLLDHVGADHVVLGSDWPFVGWNPSPVAWVLGLRSLTQDEKNKIVSENLEKLLGL